MSVRVTSRFTIYPAVIKQLEKAAKESLVQTAMALQTEIVSSQVMPFDTGTLQNDSTFVNDSGANNGTVQIVSSTPYARRLYYHPEYNFQTVNNPNAKGKWFDDWLPGGSHEDFCEKTYKELFKRNGGL